MLSQRVSQGCCALSEGEDNKSHDGDKEMMPVHHRHHIYTQKSTCLPFYDRSCPVRRQKHFVFCRVPPYRAYCCCVLPAPLCHIQQLLHQLQFLCEGDYFISSPSYLYFKHLRFNFYQFTSFHHSCFG